MAPKPKQKGSGASREGLAVGSVGTSVSLGAAGHAESLWHLTGNRVYQPLTHPPDHILLPQAPGSDHLVTWAGKLRLRKQVYGEDKRSEVRTSLPRIWGPRIRYKAEKPGVSEIPFWPPLPHPDHCPALLAATSFRSQQGECWLGRRAVVSPSSSPRKRPLGTPGEMAERHKDAPE